METHLKRNKMTPKERAEELVDKFILNVLDYDGSGLNGFKAKQCALICVDEINKAIDFDFMEVQNLESQHRYWDEVEQEIKKL